MIICQEILTGLKRAANSSLVTDEYFDNLLKHLSEYLANVYELHSVDFPNSTPKIEVLKEAYTSLLGLLIESRRRNVPTSEISNFLSSLKFSEHRVKKVVAVYSSNESVIHKSLLSYGSKPMHVYNVTWKLNFCVKSSFSQLEGKPIYYITLNVAENSFTRQEKEKKVTFVCTVLHLQELVSKLRAASRKLEAIAAIAR